MNRWQTIAVTTGVVTLLSAGTALAVGVGQGGSPNTADPRDGSAAAGQASVVQVEDRQTTSARPTTSRTPMPKVKISADQAAKIALAKVGGGYVDEIEREIEHGRWEWEVEVVKSGTEYDVRVDAQTGSITRFRVDDRADDRSDDRSDDRRSDDRSDDHSGDRSRDRSDNSGRGGHDDADHADDRDDSSGHGSGDDRYDD